MHTFNNNDYFPADFLQPWQARRQKCAPPLELGLDGQDGVVVFRVVWPALPAERPIGAGHTQKLFYREQQPLVFVFTEPL
jgi:hypothetical protein